MITNQTDRELLELAERLVMDHGNNCFDCGAWDIESNSNSYYPLNEKAQQAKKALLSHIESITSQLATSQARIAELEAKLAEAGKDRKIFRRHVSNLVEYQNYETEYDGRMYSICHSCGAQDEADHRPGCEFEAAREALLSS